MIALEAESNSKTINDNRKKIIMKNSVKKVLTCIHLFEDKALRTFHFKDIQTDNYFDCRGNTLSVNWSGFE